MSKTNDIGKVQPIHIDPKGGTPGRRVYDGVSRAGDATDLVSHISMMHGIKPHEARALIDQARGIVGEYVKCGWEPDAAAHAMLLSLVMAAHQSQTTWRGLTEFVGQYAGHYYDLVGRYMEREGETHETRAATQGVALGVY